MFLVSSSAWIHAVMSPSRLEINIEALQPVAMVTSAYSWLKGITAELPTQRPEYKSFNRHLVYWNVHFLTVFRLCWLSSPACAYYNLFYASTFKGVIDTSETVPEFHESLLICLYFDCFLIDYRKPLIIYQPWSICLPAPTNSLTSIRIKHCLFQACIVPFFKLKSLFLICL